MRLIRGFATPIIALAALSCSGDSLVLPGGARPARIAVADGDQQRGSVGSLLPDSIMVQVTDADGHGMSGVSVFFGLSAATSGDVIPDTTLTDVDGFAGARWILGAEVGDQSVDAGVVGQPLTVRVNATAEAPSSGAITAESGDGQTAPAGTALADPLVVRITDEFGTPVGGVTVRWTASSGSVSPAETTTDSDGRAAAIRVLGASAGAQTARAASGDLAGSPVIFTHTAMPGPAATSLVLISGDDQSGAPGAELSEPLKVRLVDADGNGVAGRAVSWVAATGGSATPESSDTDGDGYATTRWTLGASPGPHNLSAVVSGVGIVDFTASGVADGPSPAHHLVFLVQPPETVEKGSRITPAVAVAVVDKDGIPVANSGIEITVSLISDQGPQGRSKSERTVDGIAVFDDLTAKEVGTFRLLAEARGQVELGTVESRPFQVYDGREDDD